MTPEALLSELCNFPTPIDSSREVLPPTSRLSRIDLDDRNVSMKMRHPGQEITLAPHQSKMGLLIQAASGKAGGLGILPLNLFGWFSYASAKTMERCLKTSSAMQY